MSHVASQEILYPGQVPGGDKSQSGSAAGDFIFRRKFLTGRTETVVVNQEALLVGSLPSLTHWVSKMGHLITLGNLPLTESIAMNLL